MMDGGYDDGYRRCPCFWGQEPGSLVKVVGERVDLEGREVLDVGCGEGKNAAFLHGLGARVRAIDISQLAIDHAIRQWPTATSVSWEVGDFRDLLDRMHVYDLVIAYGALHCLESKAAIASAITMLQKITRPGGLHVVCTFNDRGHQGFARAHPGFEPTLLAHSWYRSRYKGWHFWTITDSDLNETHPSTLVPHTHSMTRFIAAKPTP